MNSKQHFETLQLHAGQGVDPTTGSRAVPIYQTTSYVFSDTQHAERLFSLAEPGNIYTRIMNPTTDVLEQRIAALEGGVGALAVASGSAAITYGILNILRAGQNVVAASTLYGGTHNLLAHTLPQYGITTRFVNADCPEEFESAIDEDTRLVYIEALGNPSTNVPDFEAIAAVAHAHHLPLMVDATFATPYLCRPFQHGADIVVHSATKFLGGHGTSIGGVIVDGGKFDWAAAGLFPGLCEPDESYHGIAYVRDVGAAAYITRCRTALLRDMGACLSPFNAFLLLNGVETLSLRLERHVENAMAVATFLEEHPMIEEVSYPGLASSRYHQLAKRYFPRGAGSIFTCRVKGGALAARKMIDALKLFSQLANVADAKSLVIHPASTTHAQLSGDALLAAGVTEDMVRISVGLEHKDDLIADLAAALGTL